MAYLKHTGLLTRFRYNLQCGLKVGADFAGRAAQRDSLRYIASRLYQAFISAPRPDNGSNEFKKKSLSPAKRLGRLAERLAWQQLALSTLGFKKGQMKSSYGPYLL